MMMAVLAASLMMLLTVPSQSDAFFHGGGRRGPSTFARNPYHQHRQPHSRHFGVPANNFERHYPTQPSRMSQQPYRHNPHRQQHQPYYHSPYKQQQQRPPAAHQPYHHNPYRQQQQQQQQPAVHRYGGRDERFEHAAAAREHRIVDTPDSHQIVIEAPELDKAQQFKIVAEDGKLVVKDKDRGFHKEWELPRGIEAGDIQVHSQRDNIVIVVPKTPPLRRRNIPNTPTPIPVQRTLNQQRSQSAATKRDQQAGSYEPSNLFKTTATEGSDATIFTADMFGRDDCFVDAELQVSEGEDEDSQDLWQGHQKDPGALSGFVNMRGTFVPY